MKIASVVGARPQFIKCAPVSKGLRKEGIVLGVYLTGDVMVDALQHNLKIAEKDSSILEDLNLIPKNYYVATVQRPANTDSKENLTAIIDAFCEITEDSSSPIVFPVHPRTVKFLKEYGLYDRLPSGLVLIDPLPYLDMLGLMSNAKKILTDSGGMQKEAYILNVPCVTLRENTEWVETIQDGRNVLTGADKSRIVGEVQNIVKENIRSTRFGYWHTKEKIAAVLCHYGK